MAKIIIGKDGTMTDKELLELAAKAAGMKSGTWFDGWNDEGRETGDYWNPLTDDGDAIRLAVKVGMIVGTYANYSTVDLLSPNERIETITEWHVGNSDPYATTRRAIVRAAAEIGKTL